MPEATPAEAEQLALPIGRGFGKCGYCLRQFQAGERECPACSPKLALVTDIGSYRDFRGEAVPDLPEPAHKPFRVLVTGSRTWSDEGAIWDAITDAIDEQVKNGETEFVIVHGHCPRGADAIADFYCEDQAGWRDNMGQQLAVERHPADWERLGRRAGFARNAEMVRLGADLCLVFIVDGSRGASHTAGLAEKAGIPVRRFERSRHA